MTSSSAAAIRAKRSLRITSLPENHVHLALLVRGCEVRDADGVEEIGQSCHEPGRIPDLVLPRTRRAHLEEPLLDLDQLLVERVGRRHDFLMTALLLEDRAGVEQLPAHRLDLVDHGYSAVRICPDVLQHGELSPDVGQAAFGVRILPHLERLREGLAVHSQRYRVRARRL